MPVTQGSVGSGKLESIWVPVDLHYTHRIRLAIFPMIKSLHLYIKKISFNKENVRSCPAVSLLLFIVLYLLCFLILMKKKDHGP